jgi:hemolysin III
MEYRAGELAADRVIPVVGTLAGTVGSAILVGIAAAGAVLPTFSSSLVYSVCLVAMLGCSAAYNLASNTSRREFLRQLDHAAIFLMIAGTYTPFTTCRLHGVWAIGMTTAVWTGAVTGAVIKLICPRRLEQVSIVAYLALGWIILVGDEAPAKLGGPSDGGFDRSWRRALFHRDRLYLWRALPFHHVIWHGFVLVAASCHYAAILHGVVLALS